MRVSHAAAALSAVFDDPNLVSCAGLAPALALARRCGLQEMAEQAVRLGVPGGAGAGVKVPALVAGMVAGADSIEDMDLLRHGGMGRLFDRGPGAVDVGHVPAVVHLRARPAA